MTDDRDWTPSQRQRANEATPGETLWTVIKGTETRRAELRDFGRVGAELQIFVNDEFVSARRLRRVR